MGHRPMYCSDADKDDCTYEDDLIRTGIPIFHRYLVIFFLILFDIN